MTSLSTSDSGVVVVTVHGDLDLHSAATVRELLLAAVTADPARAVVCHLSDAPFIDSSGLAVLLDAHHVAKRHGSRLHLAGLHPVVLRLLAITRLDSVVYAHADLESALADASLTDWRTRA